MPNGVEGKRRRGGVRVRRPSEGPRENAQQAGWVGEVRVRMPNRGRGKGGSA